MCDLLLLLDASHFSLHFHVKVLLIFTFLVKIFIIDINQIYFCTEQEILCAC